MFDMDEYLRLKNEHIRIEKSKATNEKKKQALDRVRIYLDLHGKAMPKRKWYYDPADRTTVKFLDGIHTKCEHCGRGEYREVINPNFAYGHIM